MNNKERIFVSVLFRCCLFTSFVFLAGSGCDAEEQDDARDMNCGEDYLFDYGILTAERYVSGVYGLYLLWKGEYEYDDSKKTSSAYIEYYNESGLTTSFTRSYFYDEEDRLIRQEWVNHFEDGSEDQPAERAFIYDGQGRLVLEENWAEYDGKMELVTFNTWEYGENGLVERYYYGQTPLGTASYGRQYEYDDNGRNTKLIFLDENNYMAQTEDFIAYEYDSKNRLRKATFHYVDWNGLGPLDGETDYSYLGSTGLFTESEDTEGNRTTYEWEDLVLTIVREDSYGVSERKIHTFTEAGSSAAPETTPVPPSTWPRSTYGNGHLSGCAGQ